MSRISSSGGIPRPSASGTPRPGGSSTMGNMKSGKCDEIVTSTPKCPKKAAKEEKPFTLPPFSIPCKVEPEKFDKLKKKIIRRNAPPGEDLKEIKKITASLCNQESTIHEYVGLVGSYTGDNGNILRLVLAEDLASFRGLARKVYETMTQDVSDVLINEQIDLTDYYKEKQMLLQEKMMKAINEIFELAPEFDFQEYYKDKENYLASILPIPSELSNTEELQVYQRQAAYHRLQWLRSEGVRLNEENQRLQCRLAELKRQQKEEYMKAAQREEMAAMRREQLQCQEAQMKDHLEHLSESVEQTIIEKETEIQEESTYQSICESANVDKKSAKPKIHRPSRPEWNQETAVELEEVNNEGLNTPSLQVSGISASDSTMRRDSRSGPRRPFAPQNQSECPCQSNQNNSRSQSPYQSNGTCSSPPPPCPPQQPEWKSVTTRMAKDSTTLEERPPQPPPQQQRSGRRSQAPRDSWGGFC